MKLMCIDEALLSSYLDGELKEPYKSQTEEHLAHCSACRARLERLRTISQALAADGPSQEELDARKDTTYRILEKKFFSKDGKKPGFFRRRVEMGLSSMITAAAGLIVVFIGGFVLFGTSSEQTSEIIPSFTVQADSQNVHFVSSEGAGLDGYSLEEILAYLDSKGYNVDISIKGLQPVD